ncbi:FkbM family methyltransferase [Aminobacter anthyllidis]|uniref:FkbM family methyltransferase n=1 Tax=Aminobacter anthyllidis TaxID=1035067 RepID=A0A9X1AGE4_9HYPH|nr:FkbM family methyltransferase [Aminobacter anthyllidis]MBT1159187.1 FkbM family methyltransferase [Aminobacter anthyllidis]
MKCCVYTVLLGGYEDLNEQPAASRSNLPFICLTDDPTLRSESWNCRVVEPLFPQDPIRSQRDLKIRPYLHLPGYDCSVYIDNSVILKEPPERLLELFEPEVGFLVPSHSFRETVLDEFLEVARQGLDDPTRIFEQLNHYTLSCPEVLEERPWWTGILVRDHHSARVRAMLEAWASHVMRYSRRDQLSMNMAFRFANFRPTAWAMDNRESDLHLWPHTVARDRHLGPRNPAVSLMPVAARVRHMEQKEAEWNTQEHAFRAEIARLNAKAEARRPQNRLRRLGKKILRLPSRLAVGRKPEVATLPDRVRVPSGAWIHVDPLDRRGQHLIKSGGNFNPPTLAAWHLLLQERPWTHVIDVGANYGEMLVNGGLPSGASIVAVEPNPAIRPYLERTLRESGLSATVVDAALSDKSGEAALHVDPQWSGTVRLKPGHSKTLPVRTTTLDVLLRDFDADPSTMRVLAKVDVEGHEAAVLRGALGMLPSLGDFAALVEILHVPPVDLVWLTGHFDISLLDMEPGGGLVTASPRQLGEMLGSGRYHAQDAVLRRRV